MTRFPALLAYGQRPGHYAGKLVELTNGLTDKHAAEVEKRVLPRAAEQTISQFTATAWTPSTGSANRTPRRT